jgi:hypothetical protein
VHYRGSTVGVPIFGLRYSEQTEFQLEIGKSYRVLAMDLFQAGLNVLVVDETGKPNWLPVVLFEIEPQPLPGHWEFALLDPAVASGNAPPTGWGAIWGYPEIVRNHPVHHVGVVEREVDDLRIAYRELDRADADEDE